MATKQFTFSAHAAIHAIIDPIIKALEKLVKQTDITNRGVKNLYLEGDITGNGTILDNTNTSTVEIHTDIHPDEHVHTAAQLPNSVTSTANTLARRANNGNLSSSGTTASNTGFMITDVGDIGTLFASTNDPYMTVNNTSTYTNTPRAMGVLSSASISKSGKTLKLTTHYSDWCYYWDNCRCECCD